MPSYIVGERGGRLPTMPHSLMLKLVVVAQVVAAAAMSSPTNGLINRSIYDGAVAGYAAPMLPLPPIVGLWWAVVEVGGTALRIVTIMVVAGGASLLTAPASAARLLGGVVNIDGNFDTIYDTNILRLPSGATARPGTSRDDIRYQPSGSLTYTRALGRQSILLSGLYGHDFYQNNSYLSRDRLLLHGALNYAVSRCTGMFDASLSKRQSGVNTAIGDPTAIDPGADPGVIDDSGRLIDNRQTASSYGGSTTCGGAGGGLSFGANANHFSLRNQAATRRFADSNTTTVGGFVGLGVLRPGQLQIVANYSEISYPNGLIIPGVPIPFTRAALDTYRVGLTYSRPIGTRLTGTIGGSYLMTRPRGNNAQNYNSPAYNLQLTYRPGTRLTMTLTGSRDVVSSNSVGALYQVVDAISTGATYQVSPSISGRVLASYQHRNFKQSFATIEEPIARRLENFTFVSAGVSYAPRKLYDISFDVTHSFRTSTPSIFDYNNTSAKISLSVHL